MYKCHYFCRLQRTYETGVYHFAKDETEELEKFLGRDVKKDLIAIYERSFSAVLQQNKSEFNILLLSKYVLLTGMLISCCFFVYELFVHYCNTGSCLVPKCEKRRQPFRSRLAFQQLKSYNVI